MPRSRSSPAHRTSCAGIALREELTSSNSSPAKRLDSLENKSDCKLRVARSRVGARDPPEGRAVDVVIADLEVHRVEQIKDVRTELQLVSPRTRTRFDERRRPPEIAAGLPASGVSRSPTSPAIGLKNTCPAKPAFVSLSGPTARPRVRVDDSRIDPIDVPVRFADAEQILQCRNGRARYVPSDCPIDRCD